MIKKKLYIIALIILLTLGINIETLAFDLLPKVSMQDMEDNKIEISLNISDLGDYEEGINVVSGKLIYDSNIFESVSFKGINNWSCAYNNEEGNGNQGKFMLITTNGNVRKDKEVAVIELTLKQNLTEQSTKIKIESIQTSYHSKKINAKDKEISLQIEDNNVKIISEEDNRLNLDNKNTLNVIEDKEKAEISYFTYMLIAIITIIVIIFIILIIKMKRKEKTNEE